MKKLSIYRVTLIFLAFFLLFGNAFAFSDVSTKHENYQAIKYLEEQGVIDGYGDNTFRPDIQVTRAEFLKIILEGSNIPLDANNISLPFNDTDESWWYIPYLKKAYDEKWISGYGDNTFRPGQTITKAESLKIVAEVQGWDLPKVSEKPYIDIETDDWFAPYIAFAKENGMLEDINTTYRPNNSMTRAGISEIIYRSLTIIDPDSVQNEEEEEEEEEVEDEDLENGQTIDKDFFSNIILSNNVPITFYKNEVYLIEGSTDKNTEYVTVIMEGGGGAGDYTFSSKTSNGDFSIPVFFSESGSFQLGIIPGLNGNSKAVNIIVSSSIPLENSGPSPSINSIDLDYEDGKTFVETDKSQSLKKVTLSQDDEKVIYYSRQNEEKIFLNYPDFEDFDKGEISIKVETAALASRIPLSLSSNFQSSISKTFQVGIHESSELNEDKLEASIPEKVNGSKIKFSGTNKVDIRQKAYVIKPNGFVDEISLSTNGNIKNYYGSSVIDDGDGFNFEYEISSSGTYIVGLSDREGVTIASWPIYTGSKIPLIPNYFDLNKAKLFKGSLDLNDSRDELLDLINESRDDHNLDDLVLDGDLNSLAQAHSEDMADNNYFSHVDQDGNTPNDRRLAAGIETYVFENIAKHTSVEAAHNGLMHSPSHRKTILEPDVTRLGVGIALKDGYLYITEVFSTDTITASKLEDQKNELFEEINQAREDDDIELLSYSIDLESASHYINEELIESDTSLSEMSQSLLSEGINKYNITGSILALGRNHSIWSNILESILEDEDSILQSKWKSLGIDLQLDENGNIQAILLLRQP